ncbi:hypothetical protein RFN29_15235 [Mesorhizobium sp. VK22B]|uniref:Uncharacterized protein n=1 Tax=Mesorhizobium captivum TaxID=3072319 RepID=A0ABU4Z141_9HYPH|nr:hypothetical protein [Mesorhizobium sp. VK22B]MDX8492931.1 hypothetical protein [Mesorhizobium sp. VK22B]
MANQTGIAIVIKAFLPTGKSLDEQFAALSIVKTAHETSDYSALLKAASIEEVKTEQKTRRIEDQPQAPASGANVHGIGPDTGSEPNPDYKPEPEPETKPEVKPEPADDADVPAFLKKDKKPKAA